jgi:hypothetical protein
MSKIVVCNCSEWKYSYEISAQAVFCHIHSAGPRYGGPPFNYCPWCGKKLKYKEKEEI